MNTTALERAIFSSEHCWSIATDATGVIEAFSVGAERMLGYAAADVVGTQTASLVEPDALIARATTLSTEAGITLPPAFAALVFNATRGLEDVYGLTCVRKDGLHVPAIVAVTALRDEQHAIRGFLLIGTGRIDRDPDTRALVESSGDAWLATDPLSVITAVNGPAEALLGHPREALIGQPFKRFFTDPARAEAGINRARLEGRLTDCELTARALDGALTAISFNAATIYDGQHRLLAVVASGRDMTEPKRETRTLRRANAALEDATRQKSEFLAHMSHELRAPLNAIIGLSDVLQNGMLGALSDQQGACVGLVLGGGHQLLSVVNDLLDLSKVEAGKMALHLESIDMSLLFASELALIRPPADTRRIRLAADIPLGLFIRADLRRINQVVHNLLANAVRFTTDGGQLTIAVTKVSRAVVGSQTEGAAGRLVPLADSEFLQIRVSGIGLAVGTQGAASLFTPFNSLERRLPREIRGTGLELALVRQFTELHGGAVAVDLGAGQGSSLTVWLPFSESNADQMGQPDAISAARTVLMVEADVSAAITLRVLLEGEGFRVLHAISAAAALVVASQQPLSLITLDLMMAGMDGWEFLHRLQQMPAQRRTPVVIISMAADAARGFAFGAAAVMHKPISRHELCEALTDLGLFPAGQANTLRVLIADDGPKSVELIAGRIEGMAGKVLRAFGGAEAIETARREHPNLVLLDLMMPGVNGFDVVEALKRDPDTAGIPIIVLTDKRITDTDRARLNGYVVTIMEKSAFDSEQLRAEVRRAIAGRPAIPRVSAVDRNRVQR